MSVFSIINLEHKVCASFCRGIKKNDIEAVYYGVLAMNRLKLIASEKPTNSAMSYIE